MAAREWTGGGRGMAAREWNGGGRGMAAREWTGGGRGMAARTLPEDACTAPYVPVTEYKKP